MEYTFFEYTSNTMIPGDWDWYVTTYVIDQATGGRLWQANGALDIQVYPPLSSFRKYSLTSVAFMPSNVIKQGRKALPAPLGVRWGSIRCIRTALFNTIRERLSDDDLISGQMTASGCGVVDEWTPFICNKILPVDPRGKDGVDECLELMDGGAVFSTSRYALILRGDVFKYIDHVKFPGCKLSFGVL